MNLKMPSRQTQSWVLSMLAMAVISAPALAADEQLDSKSKSLDTQVVLGSGSKISILENPASVSVVTEEDIQKNPAIGIADQLRNLPGVQVYDDGTPGMMRIRIRGEESRRVTIQIDGHAITDHSAYGAPMLLDPSVVERIEVVRGPLSVLSGSNAIGGVVNIITKRGSTKPIEGSITATGFSATSGYSTSANLMGAAGDIDWRLTAGKAHEGDRRTPDGRISPTDYDTDQLSMHVGYTSGKHYFAAKADQYRLEANTLPYFQNESQYDRFDLSIPQRDLQKFGLFYEGVNLSPVINKVESSVYYQTVDRLFENYIGIRDSFALDNVSDDLQETAGFELQVDLNLLPVGNTILGVEYEYDQLQTKKDSVVIVPPTPPFLPNGMRTPLNFYDDAFIRTFSAYIQQRVELGERTTMHLGGRYYTVDGEHRESQDPVLDPLGQDPLQNNTDERFLGSLGLVHKLEDNWTLRANLSQGYSYPTLQQLYLTTLAGGTVVSGDKNLKPEKSDVFELGTRWSTNRFMLDAAVYHIWSEDYILEVDTGEEYRGMLPIGQFTNISKVRTVGAEVQAEYYLENTDTALYVHANTTRRKLDYGNGTTTTESGTPRFSGRFGVRNGWLYSPVTDAELDIFVRGETKASYSSLDTNFQEATTTPDKRSAGYGTLNAQFSVKHDNYLNVNLSLNNLLDKSYHPYGELMGAGRSAVLSTTFKF